MKTLVILLLLGMSLSAFGMGPFEDLTEIPGVTSDVLTGTANTDPKKDEKKEVNKDSNDLSTSGLNFSELDNMVGTSKPAKCHQIFKNYNAAPLPKPIKTADYYSCEVLQNLAASQNTDFFERVVPGQTLKRSADGAITCVQRASYTIDYEQCLKALAAYNAVVIANTAMAVQQKIRTDLNQKSIQEEAEIKRQQGDFQTGALDAGIQNHEHMKKMHTEKVFAFSSAVSALTYAYSIIPGEKKAENTCASIEDVPSKYCAAAIRGNKNSILANQGAKVGLATAIAKFTAEGLASGIAMNQHGNAANQIAAVKKPYEDYTEDMMLELCVTNPNAHGCVKPGVRNPGQTFSGGEFDFGGDGTNNAFNMNPQDGSFFEEGAETNLGDGNNVAAMNSPFVDEAKAAQGILNPAAAAQAGMGGPAGGGAGGGVGGGMGGGSAALGSDLTGTDKDGNKEASIKTNKVSGAYGASGGGGYKGVGKGKEDANPFASLFDAKSQGGVEEDRSIASGDIDGQASGLFQKISKRYGVIQADKRIEANNLE